MTSARSVRPVLILLAVYFLSMWAGAAAVHAQTGVTPDVSITCEQPQAIETYPGSTRTSIVNCDLSNPSAHQIKVEMIIQSGALVNAGPASLTVASGLSTSFQVILRGDLQMAEGQHQVSITATVTQANGVQYPNGTPTTYKVLAVVKQFSRLRVASELAFIQLRPKVDYMVSYDVYNDGNALDRMNIEISNYDELSDEGFTLSLPLVNVEIESKSPPEKVRVQIRTPKNQGWTDKYYTLQFKATSDYSIRTEGIPNSQIQSVTLYIRGVYLPGFELIGTTMITALAAAAIAGRFRVYDDEEEDDDGELRILDSRLF